MPVDVLGEIILSIARSSGLSALDESVLHGPVSAASTSAQAQRLLRVVEPALRPREATGSDDRAEPLLEHIRGRLPVNQMGNTIEDVWWRLARLVRMHSHQAPPTRWDAPVRKWGEENVDWSELRDTTLTGFGLSADPEFGDTWGTMALDILQHSTIRLLASPEVEHLSNETVYWALHTVGGQRQAQEGSGSVHLQLEDDDLVRGQRLIKVQFGSDVLHDGPMMAPLAAYFLPPMLQLTCIASLAVWGAYTWLGQAGLWFAAVLFVGYMVSSLQYPFLLWPASRMMAALERRTTLRRLRAAMLECPLDCLVLRIKEGMRGDPWFCPRCRYNTHGLPTARCPECGAPLEKPLITEVPRAVVSEQPVSDPRAVRRAWLCLTIAALVPFVMLTPCLILIHHVSRFDDLNGFYWSVGTCCLMGAIAIWALPWSRAIRIVTTIAYVPLLVYLMFLYTFIFAGVVYGQWL